mmetsp:Transcript_20603/g.64811  ORF Transcript_20603/g.64811 Transcript_20603/m.64811 type:complete len:436 (-) Transcript_20603:261-1568(-)
MAAGGWRGSGQVARPAALGAVGRAARAGGGRERGQARLEHDKTKAETARSSRKSAPQVRGSAAREDHLRARACELVTLSRRTTAKRPERATRRRGVVDVPTSKRLRRGGKRSRDTRDARDSRVRRVARTVRARGAATRISPPQPCGVRRGVARTVRGGAAPRVSRLRRRTTTWADPRPPAISRSLRTRSRTPTRGRRPSSGGYAPVATNAAPSSSGPAIFAVFKTIPGLCHKQTGSTLVDPETYLAASGQAIFLTIAMAWTIAYIWNPAIIESNPLKDRIGYNNPCVAWDAPPALFGGVPDDILRVLHGPLQRRQPRARGVRRDARALAARRRPRLLGDLRRLRVLPAHDLRRHAVRLAQLAHGVFWSVYWRQVRRRRGQLRRVLQVRNSREQVDLPRHVRLRLAGVYDAAGDQLHLLRGARREPDRAPGPRPIL